MTQLYEHAFNAAREVYARNWEVAMEEFKAGRIHRLMKMGPFSVWWWEGLRLVQFTWRNKECHFTIPKRP